MLRFSTSACLALLLLLVTEPVHAEIITIDVTVKSVDVKSRTITVQTKTKTIELDVSRKATVSLKGKRATLDSLKAGQKVAISYHDVLETVVKIDIVSVNFSDSNRLDVELIEIAEINSGEGASYPWLSQDGLTIYWEQISGIWTAKRKDADSFFENKKKLFKGRHPSVSVDGLEMILLVDGFLHATTRKAESQTFKRPRIIAELRSQPKVKNPCLSQDGLSLYFNRRIGQSVRGVEMVVCTRRSRTSRWSKPKSVPIRREKFDGAFNWPFLSEV